jgi:putative flippase GtrA
MISWAKTAKSRALVRYVVIGVVMYLFSVAALAFFLHVLQVGTLLAVFLLQLLILIIGFTAGRQYIFTAGKDQRYAHDLRVQSMRYVALFTAFRALDGALCYTFIEWLGIPYWIAPLCVMGLVFIFKFLIYRHFVFAHRDNSDQKAL